MAMQVFLGLTWAVVLFLGVVGVDHASAAAALITVGVGVKKFLDAYWNVELEGGKVFDLEEPEASFRPVAPNPAPAPAPPSGRIPAGSYYAFNSFTPRRPPRRL